MRIFLSTLIITLFTSFPVLAQSMSMGDEVQKLAEAQEEENQRNPFDLPEYQTGDTTAFGELKNYTVGEEDTLHDIARHFELGFVELRAANQGIDAWAPIPGTDILLPSLHLLPRAPQDGIIVNLAEMRLYYFKDGADVPLTFPLGIGRDGLDTPVGRTTVVRKTAGPSWHPTQRMKDENPALPDRVPPGPSNPLGSHALYLGWPTYLIHGTNKPYGIGRRVSSGCIRMLPENITKVFSMVPVGTPVTVVDQPIKAAMVQGDLYLEVNPTGNDLSDIELLGVLERAEGEEPETMPEGLKALIMSAVGDKDVDVDWQAVEAAYKEKKSYPVVVGKLKPVSTEEEPAEDGGEKVEAEVADEADEEDVVENTIDTTVPPKRPSRTAGGVNR